MRRIAALALVSLSYITGLNLGEPGLDTFAHPVWVRLVEYGGIALAAMATLCGGRVTLKPKPRPALSASGVD